MPRARAEERAEGAIVGMEIGRFFGRVDDARMALRTGHAPDRRGRDEQTCANLAQEIEARPAEWEPVRAYLEDWRRQVRALRASVAELGDVSFDARREAGRITAVIGDWRIVTRVGVAHGEAEGSWIDLTHASIEGNGVTLQASESEDIAAMRAGAADLAHVLRDGAKNWLKA